MASNKDDVLVSPAVDYISSILSLRGPTTLRQILNYIQISPYCAEVGCSVDQIECFLLNYPLQFRVKEDFKNILGHNDAGIGSNQVVRTKTVYPASEYEINNHQTNQHNDGLIIIDSVSYRNDQQYPTVNTEFPDTDVHALSGLERSPISSPNEISNSSFTGVSTFSHSTSPSGSIAMNIPKTSFDCHDRLEGVQILEKALLENGPLPIRKLVGYLGNSSKSVRDAIGKNKEELLQFLVADDRFIVTGDDNIVCMKKKTSSSSDGLNECNVPVQYINISNSLPSVQHSYSEMVIKDLPHSRLVEQELERIEGIKFLTKVLRKNGPLPVQCLLGNLSQTTRNVREAIGGSYSGYLDFLRNDSHFLVIENNCKCIVHLNPEAINAQVLHSGDLDIENKLIDNLCCADSGDCDRQSTINKSVEDAPKIRYCFSPILQSPNSDHIGSGFERSVLDEYKEVKMLTVDKESVVNESEIQITQMATITQITKNGKSGFALFDNGENIFIGIRNLKQDSENPLTNLNDRFSVEDRVCIHACIGYSSGSCKLKAMDISPQINDSNHSVKAVNQDNSKASIQINAKTTQHGSSVPTTSLTCENIRFAKTLPAVSVTAVPISDDLSYCTNQPFPTVNKQFQGTTCLEKSPVSSRNDISNSSSTGVSTSCHSASLSGSVAERLLQTAKVNHDRLEGVQILAKALLENGPLPVRKLAGYIGNSSKSVRDAIGKNKEELLQFLLTDDRFIVTGEDNLVCMKKEIEISPQIKGTSNSVRAVIQDNSETCISINSQKTQPCSIFFPTSLTFENSRFSKNLPVLSPIAVSVSSILESESNFIETKSSQQKSPKNQGIEILKEVLAEKGALPAANLFGYFSKTSKSVREAVGKNPTQLLHFLMSSPHFIVQGSDNLVQVNSDYLTSNQKRSRQKQASVDEASVNSLTSKLENPMKLSCTKLSQDVDIEPSNLNLKPLLTTKLNSDITATSRAGVDFLVKVLSETEYMPLKALKCILLNCKKPICDSFGENACMLLDFFRQHKEFVVEGKDQIVRMRTHSCESLSCLPNARSLSDSISTQAVQDVSSSSDISESLSLDPLNIESVVLKHLTKLISTFGPMSVDQLKLVPMDDKRLNQSTLPQVLVSLYSDGGTDPCLHSTDLVKKFILLHKDVFTIFDDIIYLINFQKYASACRESMSMLTQEEQKCLQGSFLEVPSQNLPEVMYSNNVEALVHKGQIKTKADEILNESDSKSAAYKSTDNCQKSASLSNISEMFQNYTESGLDSIESMVVKRLKKMISDFGPVSIEKLELVMFSDRHSNQRELPDVLAELRGLGDIKLQHKQLMKMERRKLIRDFVLLHSDTFTTVDHKVFLTSSEEYVPAVQKSTLKKSLLESNGINITSSPAAKYSVPYLRDVVSARRAEIDISSNDDYLAIDTQSIERTSVESLALQFIFVVMQMHGSVSIDVLQKYEHLASEEVQLLLGKTSEGSKFSKLCVKRFCRDHSDVLRFNKRTKTISLADTTLVTEYEMENVDLNLSDSKVNSKRADNESLHTESQAQIGQVEDGDNSVLANETIPISYCSVALPGLQFLIALINNYGPLSLNDLNVYWPIASPEARRSFNETSDSNTLKRKNLKEFCEMHCDVLKYTKKAVSLVDSVDITKYFPSATNSEIVHNESFHTMNRVTLNPGGTNRNSQPDNETADVEDSLADRSGLEFLVALISCYGPLSLENLNLYWPIASLEVRRCFSETSENSTLKRNKLKQFCEKHCDVLNYTKKALSLVDPNAASAINTNAVHNTEFELHSSQEVESQTNIVPMSPVDRNSSHEYETPTAKPKVGRENHKRHTDDNSVLNDSSLLEQKALNCIIEIIKKNGPIYPSRLRQLLLGKNSSQKSAARDVLTYLSRSSDINSLTTAKVRDFLLKQNDQFDIQDGKVYLMNSKQYADLFPGIITLESKTVGQGVSVHDKTQSRTESSSKTSCNLSTNSNQKGKSFQTLPRRYAEAVMRAAVGNDEYQRSEKMPCNVQKAPPLEVTALNFLVSLIRSVGPLSFSELNDSLKLTSEDIRNYFAKASTTWNLREKKVTLFCQKYCKVLKCEHQTVSLVDSSRFENTGLTDAVDLLAVDSYSVNSHSVNETKSTANTSPISMVDFVNDCDVITTAKSKIHGGDQIKLSKDNSCIAVSSIEKKSLCCITDIIKKSGPIYVSKLKQVLLGKAWVKKSAPSDVLIYLSKSSDINRMSKDKLVDFILKHDQFDIVDGKVYLVNTKQYAAMVAQVPSQYLLLPTETSSSSFDDIRNIEADLVEESALNFLVELLRSHGSLSFLSLNSYRKLASAEVRQYFGVSSESPLFKKVKLIEFCDRHRDVLHYTESEICLVHSNSENHSPVEDALLSKSIVKENFTNEIDCIPMNKITKLLVDSDSDITALHEVSHENISSTLEHTSEDNTEIELKTLKYIKNMIRKLGPIDFNSLKSLLLGQKYGQKPAPTDILIHLSGSFDLLARAKIKEFILRHSDHIAKHDGKVYLVNSTQKASQIIQEQHEESILLEMALSKDTTACCDTQMEMFSEAIEIKSIQDKSHEKIQHDGNVFVLSDSLEAPNENSNILEDTVETLALKFLVHLIRSNGPLTFQTLSNSRHLASMEIQQLFGATSIRPWFARKNLKEFCQQHTDVLVATKELEISLAATNVDECVSPFKQCINVTGCTGESKTCSRVSQKLSKSKMTTFTTYDSLRMSPEEYHLFLENPNKSPHSSAFKSSFNSVDSGSVEFEESPVKDILPASQTCQLKTTNTTSSDDLVSSAYQVDE